MQVLRPYLNCSGGDAWHRAAIKRAVMFPAPPLRRPSRDLLRCPVSPAAQATSCEGDVWYRRVRFPGLIPKPCN